MNVERNRKHLIKKGTLLELNVLLNIKKNQQKSNKNLIFNEKYGKLWKNKNEKNKFFLKTWKMNEKLMYL